MQPNHQFGNKYKYLWDTVTETHKNAFKNVTERSQKQAKGKVGEEEEEEVKQQLASRKIMVTQVQKTLIMNIAADTVDMMHIYRRRTARFRNKKR